MLFETYDKTYSVYRKTDSPIVEINAELFDKYQYYYDDWPALDGWEQTLTESWLPVDRGGIYKRDFITISGIFVVKIQCTADYYGLLTVYGETGADTWKLLGADYLNVGNNLLTFVINDIGDVFTGLGLIWDKNHTVEIQKIFISKEDTNNYFVSPNWNFVTKIYARSEPVVTYEKISLGQNYTGELTRKFCSIDYISSIKAGDILIDSASKQERIIGPPEVFDTILPHIEFLAETLQYEIVPV